MLEANVKIIEVLRAFLQRVCDDPEVRQLFTLHPGDFTRQRKLPLQKVVELIINQPKRSLSIELKEFFEQVFPGQAPCSKSAFCQQRTKLKPCFFSCWNQLLVAAFDQFYAGALKRWHGYRLWATDGSFLYLIDHPQVTGYFGKKPNQFGAQPLARVVQVEDVLNHLIVRGDLFSCRTSEQQVVYNWVDGYPSDALLLFDRGVASYALLYLLLLKKQPFLIRARTDNFQEVKRFLQSPEWSRVVPLHPSPHAIPRLKTLGIAVKETTAIQVRLIKVPLKDQSTEVLLTNLYDPELSGEDFQEAYHFRWGIEGRWNSHKNQQQVEIFSGHKVQAIFQDYYASLFTCNLQSLIENQCAPYVALISEKRQHTYKVNRNLCWAYLKFKMVQLFLNPNPLEVLLHLQRCFEKTLEPERPGRKVPRDYRQRRLTGKYQTFTNYRRAI